MSKNQIIIKGAREHNLKNINLTIPRDKFIVFTGVSGSGKSSLAFDTIYADGQRRYIESLSSYARQFLGQMEKPDVDDIEGLSPAISIDQKTTSKNPRSTVGTVTEIYDYLRLLYARIGVPHCPVCGKKIAQQSIDQIVEQILSLGNGKKIQILAPIVRGRKGEHRKILEEAHKDGFVRVRIDKQVYDLAEEIKLDKKKKHHIEIVVDRLILKDGIRPRLTDSLETAAKLTDGLILIDVIKEQEILFSQNYACPEHGLSIGELTPRLFSFNSPDGACKTCTGLGFFRKIDPALLVPNPNLSIRQGAISAFGFNYSEKQSIANMYYHALAEHYHFSLDTPFSELPEQIQNILFYGTGDERILLRRQNEFENTKYYARFEGIVHILQRRYKETNSQIAKDAIGSYMKETLCPECKGKRLKKEVLAVTVGGKNIDEFAKMSIKDAISFVDSLSLTNLEQKIAEMILKEIKERLQFLNKVGLSYLTLSRSAGTLSGGESQRIRLATQIGASLMGVLYILDEPSIGLHQRDNSKLIDTLKNLRDLGNTVIVVEHDEETMQSADFLVDIGPGPGIHGGEVVFAGPISEIKNAKNSLTGDYLLGRKKISVPNTRRKGNGKFIKFSGCEENNLKKIDFTLPLGTFTCVTGVSGSGKSTLVNEIVYKYLAQKLNRAQTYPGKFKQVKGLENLDKVIDISQSPIGRTPRSNPGTYTGVFNDIRELFANTKDAKLRGYSMSRFSFNVKGGRCEACHGDGIVKIEMHFLPDVYVPCDVCGGKRYNHETLEVKYREKSIYDILEMTVEEGISFFENIPKIQHKLQTLAEVGLNYIKIGQPATTLSGGEAQRVKLATELAKKATGKTLYILDEPTTGLHTDDVKKLIQVLQKLVDANNTVLVIEHDLNVIKTADYIVDLGPEGGDEGGQIIAAGAPEKIVHCKQSYTGAYLKSYLK